MTPVIIDLSKDGSPTGSSEDMNRSEGKKTPAKNRRVHTSPSSATRVGLAKPLGDKSSGLPRQKGKKSTTKNVITISDSDDEPLRRIRQASLDTATPASATQNKPPGEKSPPSQERELPDATLKISTDANANLESLMKPTFREVKAGQFWVMRSPGRQIKWPAAIVCDEELLQKIEPSQAGTRPDSALQQDGSWLPDFADGGSRSHERQYPLLSYAGDLYWLPRASLTILDTEKARERYAEPDLDKDERLLLKWWLATESDGCGGLDFFKKKFSREKLDRDEATTNGTKLDDERNVPPEPGPGSPNGQPGPLTSPLLPDETAELQKVQSSMGPPQQVGRSHSGMKTGAELTIPEIEVILEKHVQEMYDDHEYFLKRWLPQARRCYQRGIPECHDPPVPENPAAGPTSVPEKYVDKVSPFAKMEPIQYPTPAKKTSSPSVVNLTYDTYPDPRSNKSVRTYISVPVTTFKSDAVTLPPYKSYISLKQNVIAENDRKLLYWPYFGDEEENRDLREELNARFDALIDQRPRRILQTQKSRKLRPYVEGFLQEIGSGVSDILRYLLDPQEPDGLDKQLLHSRKESCKLDFNRNKTKWINLYKNMPTLSEKSFKLAALACHAFLHICGMSIWHVVRESPFTQSELEKLRKDTADKRSGPKDATTFRELACRVCHLHNCPFHGEIRESSDDDNDNVSSSSDSGDTTGTSESALDSDNEPSDINFKKLVNAPPREHSDKADTSVRLPKRNATWWLTNSKTHLLHERRPFYPCSHEGSCEEAHCQCFQQNIACEKTCACAESCRRRFRGCACAQVARACFQDRRCECFQLNRECDQDLCGSCGADAVLDPVNRYSKALVGCANCGVQRNVPRRTLLGHSEVQGFGLYMGERARAHDYLGEYKGEVITKGEADRRGTIYQHLLTNYLFSLNADQEVDSTRAGNKFRFINNSEVEGTINCYAKPMLANTVTRIGMYAKRDIAVGEELFFNYGYPKEATKLFWEKGEDPREREKRGGKGNVKAVKTKKPRAAPPQPVGRPEGNVKATGPKKLRLSPPKLTTRQMKELFAEEDAAAAGPRKLRLAPPQLTDRQKQAVAASPSEQSARKTTSPAALTDSDAERDDAAAHSTTLADRSRNPGSDGKLPRVSRGARPGRPMRQAARAGRVPVDLDELLPSEDRMRAVFEEDEGDGDDDDEVFQPAAEEGESEDEDEDSEDEPVRNSWRGRKRKRSL